MNNKTSLGIDFDLTGIYAIARAADHSESYCLQICDEPKMFLYDTPGILTPKVESAEVALKLAACNSVRAQVLGEEIICDYILYHLNKHNLTSRLALCITDTE